ncbi:hypothetical protein ACFL3E_00470 [Patescibacteria group bacterium]
MKDYQNNYQKYWPKGFIALPREYIRGAFSGGLINADEFFVINLLWVNANPYGLVPNINSTVLVEMSQDYFDRRRYFKNPKNAVNKILLSLKDKNFIFYPNFQGKTGTYDVKLNKFFTKDHTFIDLDKKVRDEHIVTAEVTAKINDDNKGEIKNNDTASAEVGEDMQKLKNEISHMVKGFSMSDNVESGRSSNNENENDNDKYNNNEFSNSINNISSKKTVVTDFNWSLLLKRHKTYSEDMIRRAVFEALADGVEEWRLGKDGVLEHYLDELCQD